jgi:hypothetical protein
VYQYYQELSKQKKYQDMELEHKLVDKAAMEKRMMEDERVRN